MKLSREAIMTLIVILAEMEAAYEGGENGVTWEGDLRTIYNNSEANDWRQLDHRESLKGMAGLVFENFSLYNLKSLTQLREELAAAAQLYDTNRGESRPVVEIDGDTLVEQIVGVLQKPLARQLLPQSDIDQLRKAILDPMEMAKVKVAENETLYCVCGEPFSPRETITWTVNAGKTQLYCSKCMPAANARCSAEGCNTSVGLNRQAVYCRAHQPGLGGMQGIPFEAVPAVEDAAGWGGRLDAPQPLDDLLRAANRLRVPPARPPRGRR